MQNDTRIAVDVAKAVFEVAVSDRPGHVSRRERLPRAQFLPFFAQHPAATVVMEACGSAHHWGRRIEEPGPQGRSASTSSRPSLRAAEQDGPHRRQGHSRGQPQRRHSTGAREVAWPSRPDHVSSPIPLGVDDGAHGTAQRPAWVCFGSLVSSFPWEHARSCPRCGPSSKMPTRTCPRPCVLSSPRPVTRSATSRRRIKQVERQLEAMAEQLPAVVHLQTIPGIGLLTATALVAFIGDIHRFPSGRHLASYLGLTPREFSSGLKTTPGSNLQAGRRLPTHPPHPRSALGPSPRSEDQAARSSPRVGPQAREDSRPQQSRRRRGQQAGSHRLGRLEPHQDYGQVEDRGLDRPPTTTRS